MTSVSELVAKWCEVTDDALEADNDWLHKPDEETAAWAVAQLVRWPTRLHPDRTTNDRFMRLSVAAIVRAQAAEIARKDAALHWYAERMPYVHLRERAAAALANTPAQQRTTPEQDAALDEMAAINQATGQYDTPAQQEGGHHG